MSKICKASNMFQCVLSALGALLALINDFLLHENNTHVCIIFHLTRACSFALWLLFLFIVLLMFYLALNTLFCSNSDFLAAKNSQHSSRITSWHIFCLPMLHIFSFILMISRRRTFWRMYRLRSFSFLLLYCALCTLCWPKN